MVVARNAHRPQVVVGRGEALITFTTTDRSLLTDGGTCFLAGSAVHVPLPLGSGPAQTVVGPRAGDCAIDQVHGPAVGRLGSHAAMVTCLLHDDCSTDPNVMPECWSCDLRVVSHPEDEAHFALPPRQMTYSPAFAFAGRTLFVATTAHQGGEARNLIGFTVHEGRADRGLLSSWPRGEERLVTHPRIVISPFDEDRAFVEWSLRPDGPYEHRVVLERGAGRANARGVARPVSGLSVVEEREGREALPRLRVREAGRAVEIEGLPSRRPRFAPSLVSSGQRTWLFFSEGLQRRTRIRLAEIDVAGERFAAPPRLVSNDGAEAGRSAADAFADRLVVAWAERRSGEWRVRAAELRCAP